MTPAQRMRERLREAICESPLTYRATARKSGYSHSYIDRIVAGIQMNPTIGFISAMAETLNVNPAWLAGWSDEKARQ